MLGVTDEMTAFRCIVSGRVDLRRRLLGITDYPQHAQRSSGDDLLHLFLFAAPTPGQVGNRAPFDFAVGAT